MTARSTIKEQAEILKNGAKYQAVKLHVKKNQKFYLGVGVGAFVILVTRRPAINVVVSPLFNNTPVFNNSVNFGGHMTKMVKRMSDGAMWETVTEAAKEAGVSLSFMSRHLNGHEPHVYNEVYKIVGIGTTG